MVASPGNRFLHAGPQDWLTHSGSSLTRMPVKSHIAAVDADAGQPGKPNRN